MQPLQCGNLNPFKDVNMVEAAEKVRRDYGEKIDGGKVVAFVTLLIVTVMRALSMKHS